MQKTDIRNVFLTAVRSKTKSCLKYCSFLWLSFLRFYVLKSKEALELAKELTPYTFGAPVLILVCYDGNEAWRTDIDEFYETYTSGEQDCAIAAATMMYEAESLGVHTLWIRGFNSKEFVKRLDLPIRMLPVMILALGYPSADSHPSKLHGLRKPLEEIAFEL